MCTITYVKNADLVIELGEQYISYYFDKGMSICVRPMDALNSYVGHDKQELLIEDAKAEIDHGATIIDGEIPGWERCKDCGEWIETDVHRFRCGACSEYEYNHQGA
jgi:hypothetical protein